MRISEDEAIEKFLDFMEALDMDSNDILNLIGPLAIATINSIENAENRASVLASFIQNMNLLCNQEGKAN